MGTEVPIGPHASLVASLLLVAGCARHAPSVVDPTLPEETPELGQLAPSDVLVEAAEDLDPTPRARALRALVEHAPEPAGGDWGPRALFDPSPWVQRAGVEALTARLPEPASVALLERYVAREAADPYVRGLAARTLGPESQVAREAMSRAWRTTRRAWERAPLAFAAAVLGDEQAVDALGATLAAGDLALETRLFLALGESGLTALLPALTEAQNRVEDELVLPVAGARLALGDDGAEQALRRAALGADIERAFEAVDLLARIDHPSATSLLRRTRAGGAEAVRRYAELVLAAQEGQTAPLLRAAADPDPELRSLAVRFAAEAARRAPDRASVARQARRVVELGLADELPNVRLTALDAAVTVEVDPSLLRENLHHPIHAVRLGAAAALMAHAPPR